METNNVVNRQKGKEDFWARLASGFVLLLGVLVTGSSFLVARVSTGLAPVMFYIGLLLAALGLFGLVTFSNVVDRLIQQKDVALVALDSLRGHE